MRRKPEQGHESTAVARREEPEAIAEPLARGSVGEGLVSAGAAVVRIENEQMTQVALARPRNEETVIRGALGELRLVPDLASRAWYSIPYKKHDRGCPRRGSCSCPETKVEGLSVKAAMSLLRRWGNAVCRVRVDDESADEVTLSGVFLDAETNVRVERPFRASKFKTMGNSVIKMSGRDLDQAIQAASSKAVRNAILAGLPWWLTETYFREARKIALEEMKGESKASGKTVIDNMIAAFSRLGVTKEMLDAHLGHAISKVTESELVDLRGIYNAISNGEATVADVFNPPDAQDGEKPLSERIKGAKVETKGDLEDLA